MERPAAQCTGNHLEVSELSPAKSLTGKGDPQKMSIRDRRLAVPGGGRLLDNSGTDHATPSPNPAPAPFWIVRSGPAGGRTTQRRDPNQAPGTAVPDIGDLAGAPWGVGDSGRTAPAAVAGRHVCGLRS